LQRTKIRREERRRITFFFFKSKKKERKKKKKKTDGDRTLNNMKFRKLRNKGQQRNDSEKQKGNWSS